MQIGVFPQLTPALYLVMEDGIVFSYTVSLGFIAVWSCDIKYVVVDGENVPYSIFKYDY